MTIEQQSRAMCWCGWAASCTAGGLRAAELRDQGALHDGALRGVRLIGANCWARTCRADRARRGWNGPTSARGPARADLTVHGWKSPLAAGAAGEAALAGAVCSRRSCRARSSQVLICGAQGLGERTFRARLKRAQLHRRVSPGPTCKRRSRRSNLEGADLSARLQEANWCAPLQAPI